jgi:hypothetical protein
MEIETQTVIEEVVQPPKNKGGRPRKGSEKPKPETDAPKRLGRPLTALWRYQDNGVYNSMACDPEYAKKFWHSHYKKPFTCGICNATLHCCGAIPRHERTLHCQLAKLRKEQEKKEEAN